MIQDSDMLLQVRGVHPAVTASMGCSADPSKQEHGMLMIVLKQYRYPPQHQQPAEQALDGTLWRGPVPATTLLRVNTPPRRVPQKGTLRSCGWSLTMQYLVN